MKLSIVYHSETGNTKKVAQVIADAAGQVEGIEAKAMSVDTIDKNFIDESSTVIFGCPTYCGTFSWQLKRFIDTSRVNVKGKLGGVFVTENFLGGGADVAELSLVGCLLVRGMLIYSGGAADGQPFTHFGAVLQKGGDELQLERAKIFAQRIAKKALEIFK